MGVSMNGNLLFITGCYPKENNNYFIENSKVMPQNAANVLSWRIIDGLEQNIPGRFEVITLPFIGYYPFQFSKLIIPSIKWSHNGKDIDQQIGFINFKGIETFIKSEKVYRYLIEWYKKSDKNRNVLIYSHYAGFMRGIGKAKKKYPDFNITCLITDMPEAGILGKKETFLSRLRHTPRNMMFKITHDNMQYVSSYVYLAEKMKNYVDDANKKYVVIEGISDVKDLVCFERKSTKQTTKVVYTGTLHRKYGILQLIEAFQYLDKNIELHVCGSGDAEEEIAHLSQTMDNLFFYGIVEHHEAIELQQSADILINPRPNEGLYTALSFPSKTMEYMIAGKPVICYKLAGIPDDYDNYLLYLSSMEPQEMAREIKQVCEMSKSELFEIGLRNYKYVKENKNPQKQVKKILEIM